MKTLKIENNDLVLDGQKKFIMIDGQNEKAQCMERILTTRKGEWFLNILHGLDYNEIFTKPFNEERARLALVEAVSQDSRTENIEDVTFEFDRLSRNLSVKIKVKMQEDIVEEVIPLE